MERKNPRPLLRRSIFNLLMLIGVWLVIEACSLAAIFLFMGTPSQLAMERRNAAAQEPFQPGGLFRAPDVIHPYLGCVMETKDDGGLLSIDGKYRVTEFGFTDSASPIHKRSPGTVIVGILGGSVARQFSMDGTDQLAHELSKSPAFTGKKFEFVRLANNGYKQPQQLMTLNYMLTLGAEFDILINLDGVNEAALPGMDNVPYDVNSAYPRDWGKLIATTSSPEFVRRVGYISYLRELRRNTGAWGESIPWRYSPTVQLICGSRLDRLGSQITTHLQALTDVRKTQKTYCGFGPPEKFESEEAMYDHCIEIWQRSSILLNQVCAARGIRYFHFLQPNQYLAGTKPMGKEEAAGAVDEKSGMCHAIRACFPLMKAKGPELIEAGVAFTDLTSVFADHPEPIYIDLCCHVKEEGDLILAKAIAARIRDDSH